MYALVQYVLTDALPWHVQVLSSLTSSRNEECPTNPLKEQQLRVLRPEKSKCTRPISYTAQDLREFLESTVTDAGKVAENAYQVRSSGSYLTLNKIGCLAC